MIVVELTFDPDSDARLALRPQHRERTAALHAAGELAMGGPYADERGALILFRADRARVDELLAEDPYYSAEGVTVASVREWTPVVGG